MGFLLNEIFNSLNYLVYLHLQDSWVQCQTFFSIWPKSDGGATVNVAHIHIPHITCRKGLKKKAKGTVSVIYCLYNKPLSKLSGLRQQLFSYMCSVTSVASSSLRRHGPYPTMLLCPWIFQTRILECVAISSSTGSSQPRDWSRISCIAGGFFYHWATGSPLVHSYMAQPFRLELVGQFSDTHLRSFMWPVIWDLTGKGWSNMCLVVG